MFRRDCPPTHVKIEGKSRLVATYYDSPPIVFASVISTARDIRTVSVSDVLILRAGEKFRITGSSIVFQNGKCNSARIIDIRPWLRTNRPCLHSDRQGTFGHYSLQYSMTVLQVYGDTTCPCVCMPYVIGIVHVEY